MARAAATGSSNGTPVRTPGTANDAGKQGLARTLETKLEQGFTIESESDTQAVLVMKGRRRWLGLTNASSVRYEVTVDREGHVTSQRL